MKTLLIFNFCWIIVGSDAVITVTGYRGRSVQIKCTYESGYEDYNKYLCRGECPRWPATKDIPIHSGSSDKDPRFSLYDNKAAKIFTVTITDLRAEDANIYWCVIERTWPVRDDYTDHQLLKIDDPPSSTVSPSTHTTYSATSHITSRSEHAETTPPATDNIQHKSATHSSSGLVTILISTGAVMFMVGVIIVIYCKRKRPVPVTIKQASKETSDVYENGSNFYSAQEGGKNKLPKSVCKSPETSTQQSDTIYQNSSIVDIQSNQVYQNSSFGGIQSNDVYQNLSH